MLCIVIPLFSSSEYVKLSAAADGRGEPKIGIKIFSFGKHIRIVRENPKNTPPFKIMTFLKKGILEIIIMS